MNAEEYSEHAKKYFEKRKYDKAITNLTKVIELEPNNPFAYCKRGLAYEKIKKFDLSITDYTKAIQIKPDDGNFYFERAGVYAFQENKNMVIADFEKFLYLAPNDEKAGDTRKLLEGLKNGEIVFYKGRIVNIYDELERCSILIIIFNFIPIIPIVKAFVWIWNGFGVDMGGIKDEFKYIVNTNQYTLGDDFPIIGLIFILFKAIADTPDSRFFRGFLRFFFVYCRLICIWLPILAAIILASPIVGIVRGIILIVQRKKWQKLAAKD